jgi:hypothetical protein
MSEIWSAIAVVAIAFTVAPWSSHAHAEDASAVVPEYIQKQARWVRAERDRANARRAKVLLRRSDYQHSGRENSATVRSETEGSPLGKSD